MNHSFVSCVVALFTGASAFSQTLISTNFGVGYEDGDIIGQQGWGQTGAAAANRLNIASGKAVLAAGQLGDDVFNPFSSTVPTTSGNGLLSTISLSITSASTVGGGDYIFHLSNPAGTTGVAPGGFYQRMYVQAFEDGFVFGLVDTSGTGSTVTYGSTKLSFDVEYTVDILWNFIEGDFNDTFVMSVDDTEYLTHLWTSTDRAEPLDLAAVNLRQGGTNSTPGALVSNLSVAAVPEPGVIALLGLGLGSLLWARRKRK